jgi:hypothetical protein
MFEALQSYASIQAAPPDEDKSNTEDQIDGSNQTNILLSPPLNTSGSSGMDGHELGDHDDKLALQNHLKRRLAAKMYMARAAELKGMEQDATVDDESLDGCGAEPGPEHMAWSDILKKRREKIRDDGSNRQDVSPSGSGISGIAGGAT